MSRLATLTLILLTGLFFKTRAQEQLSLREDIAATEQKRFENRAQQTTGGADNTYNVTYSRCDWAVDPAVKYISGHVTSYFKPLIASFSTIAFDLSSALTTDSVKYHGNKLPFSHSGDLLSVNLPTVIPVSVPDSVTVFYHGVPAGSLSQGIHGGSPIVWTLSEPFGPRDWWPCKQNLSDKIDSLDIIVTVPAGNRVGSNGTLLSETINGGSKTVHWKTRYPTAAYLVAIAVTNYDSYAETVSTPNGSFQVLNYVFPEQYASQPFQGSGIAEILKLFDSLTIAYPFAREKYGHAQFLGNGGMEHQTMSYIWGFDYSLMAHECAHQWFGDHVTCGSWQDIWLNEGFATYFEGLCIQRYRPVFWQSWRSGKIKNVTSQPGGSVLCDDTTKASRIFDDRLSYTKGAILLHMLRWQLGDSTFFLSLRNYLNDPRLRNRFAKTPDLVRHFETASHQDLTRFFDQWYYKQGFPSYTVNWSQSDDVVTLKIDQSQSHSSVSFFEMPIAVKLIGRTRDTTLRLKHSFSGQTFNIPLNFSVTDVSFDPEGWLLSGSNQVLNLNEVSSQKNALRLYPSPAGDFVILDGFAKNAAPDKIEMVDGKGNTVYVDSAPEPVNGKITIHLEDLRSGLYAVVVSAGNSRQVLKLLKR